MLKVLPIQSNLRQEEICLKCGVTYNPDMLAYAATVDDKLAGVCQFRLTSQGGEITDLAPAEDGDSFEALFIMGRGTLNFIDLCGVHSAFYSGKQPDDKLLRAIGFTQDENGVYTINLEGFFTDHCHNHSESKNKS